MEVLELKVRLVVDDAEQVCALQRRLDMQPAELSSTRKAPGVKMLLWARRFVSIAV